ncbi:hypothetical protein E4U49_004697 [Claviceps purpurea]|nr:hypothetical protein E4U49_004697 [Claviceps purpurea]
MDSLSVPDSTSPTPSTSAASASSSKQPTYTTAGTIYKPSPSQPLQPPTRRGRSLKWPIGSNLQATDLAALPRTALSEHKTSAGTSYSTMQQYTPLQQNYDRAISPFNNQDHNHAKITADIPGIQISNTSKLSFDVSDPRDRERAMKAERDSFSGNYSDGEDGDREDDGYDEDDDDDGNNNALKNLPVQSLKHLASYSNPTQKAAQKAFQRGSRSRPGIFGSSMGSASSASPSGGASLNASDGPNDAGQGFSGTNYQSQTETYTLKQAQRDVFSKLDGARSARSGTPFSAHSMLRRARSASSEVSRSSQKHLLGHSMPMPLTAGPPGQRQFRPLNFEKASKTMNVQSSPIQSNGEGDGTLLNANYALSGHGFDHFYEPPLAPDLLPTSSTSSTAFNQKAHTVQMPGFQLPSGIIDSEDEYYNTSTFIPDIYGYTESWVTKPTREPSWRYPSPKNGIPCRVGLGPMTDEAYAEHNRQLEKWWRSGLTKLNRRIETANPNHSDYFNDHRFGAIGDRRSTTSISCPKLSNTEQPAVTGATSRHSRSPMDMLNNALNMINGERSHFPPAEVLVQPCSTYYSG